MLENCSVPKWINWHSAVFLLNLSFFSFFGVGRMMVSFGGSISELGTLFCYIRQKAYGKKWDFLKLLFQYYLKLFENILQACCENQKLTCIWCVLNCKLLFKHCVYSSSYLASSNFDSACVFNPLRCLASSMEAHF